MEIIQSLWNFCETSRDEAAFFLHIFGSKFNGLRRTCPVVAECLARNSDLKKRSARLEIPGFFRNTPQLCAPLLREASLLAACEHFDTKLSGEVTHGEFLLCLEALVQVLLSPPIFVGSCRISVVLLMLRLQNVFVNNARPPARPQISEKLYSEI